MGAFLRVWCIPYEEKFTLYEIVYKYIPDCYQIAPIQSLESLKGLHLMLDKILPQIQAAQPIGCCPPDHLFQYRNAVLVSHLETDWLKLDGKNLKSWFSVLL